MSPLDFIKLPFAQLMGGVLAASLLGNIFLFYGYTHQVEKKSECAQSIKVAKKVATEKKVVIEYRQKVVTNEQEQALRAKLGDLRQQLHDLQSRDINLPEPAGTSSGTPETSGASELLRQKDELICSINTVTSEGWQEWWLKQVKIREEENVGTDSQGNRVPSP